MSESVKPDELGKPHGEVGFSLVRRTPEATRAYFEGYRAGLEAAAAEADLWDAYTVAYRIRHMLAPPSGSTPAEKGPLSP